MMKNGATCTDVTRTFALSRKERELMSAMKRFTVTGDMALYKRLLAVTEKRKPRLPRRYVVELALDFEDLDQGQLELGLETHTQSR